MLIVRIFLLLFFAVSFFKLKAQNIQKIEEVFPLKWKTYIGQTTYRSNILFHQNKIWLGSNGNTLYKLSNDENDAVFAIEPQSGKILEKIKPTYPSTTQDLDTDINGIALDGNKLFFGTDAQTLLLPAGSEATPFVGDIDNDKKLELLVATYDGNLYCYQLPLKKAKVFTGQFRHDNKNQATLRLK